MFSGSLYEMHLSTYGWMIGNNLYGLLAATGLIAFPFLWVMATAIYDAIEDFGVIGYHASEVAFNKIFMSFMGMIIVYTIAVVPMINMRIENLSFGTICQEEPGSVAAQPPVTIGDTGTSLDTAIELLRGGVNVENVRLPILWAVTTRVSAGFSRAINSGAMCFTDKTELDKKLRDMRIRDDSLKDELSQFSIDCFAKAKARLDNALKTVTLTGISSPSEATNPDQFLAASYREWVSNVAANADTNELFSRPDDTKYLGSRFFSSTPGLYRPTQDGFYQTQGATLQATTPIAGWPYDPIRDCSRSGSYCTDRERNPSYENNEGRPTCEQWWNDPDRGLLARLREDAEASIYVTENNSRVDPSVRLNNIIRQANPTGAKSEQWLADKIVSTTLVNDVDTLNVISTKIKSFINKFTGEDVAKGAVYAGGGSSLAALVGSTAAGSAAGSAALTAIVPASIAVAKSLASNAADYYATAWIVRNGYPIVQAYLEMFLNALLPIILVGSFFNIKELMMVVFVFLAVKFLTPWRYVVEYLDTVLFDIIFPNSNGILGTGAILNAPERLLLDICTTLMYTLFPLILIWVIGLMGLKSGRGMASAVPKDIGMLFRGAAQKGSDKAFK